MLHPSRRGFLKALLALPLAATVDYEQLLWTPSPIITVPAIRGVTLEEINTIALKNILPGMIDNIFRSDPLLAYLKDRGVTPTAAYRSIFAAYDPERLPS